MKARRAIELYLLWSVAFNVGLQGAPANDDFANRTVLAGTELAIAGDNAGAGLEPAEPAGGGAQLLLYSVWYSWAAPEAGALRVWVEADEFPAVATVYRGESVDELTPLFQSGRATTRCYLAAGDQVAIGVTSVYWPVWGGGGGAGGFRLCLEFLNPAPTSPNDRFEDAVAIDGSPYRVSGNLHGATRDVGEPLGMYGDAGPETLWWYFASDRTGAITVNAGSAYFRPRLVAYRGNTMTELEYLGTSDGASLTTRADPGVTIWFQLTTAYSAGDGDEFALEASFQPAAANDRFKDSARLEGVELGVREWIILATTEPGEPMPAEETERTLWWSWAAPTDGRTVVTPAWVVEYGAAALLAVYTGPTVDRLVPVLARRLSPDGPLVFAAQSGIVYHFQLRAHSTGTEPTGFDLAHYEFGLATNDDFAQARLLEGPRSGSLECTMGATREPGEPAHRGDGPNKSLWWRWQVPTTSTEASARLGFGTVDSATIAVYQGEAVDALRLVARGNDEVRFGTVASEVYHIVVEMPIEAQGDVELLCQSPGGNPMFGTIHRDVGQNLVHNPSFEALGGPLFEGWSGISGGTIQGYGADGANFAMVGGELFWQDVPTVPGQPYRLRFVHANEQGYEVELKVLVDGVQVGAVTPSLYRGEWRTAEFELTASQAVTRLGFQAGYLVNLDQVSLVWLNEPPQLVTPPVPVSVFAGSAAAFLAGISGAEPMSRQWFHNGNPIPGATDGMLSLPVVTVADGGDYWIEASNPFGSVSSPPVTLTVETPTSPQFVLHPQGDQVFEGQYVVLRAVAVGSPPLRYQWYRDGAALTNAETPALVLPHFAAPDAGIYTIRVANGAESATSLPATLSLRTEATTGGGGIVLFGNLLFDGGYRTVPIYDVDGFTPLSGSRYVAQLYAGSSEEWLRPVGEPREFMTGFNHGLWDPAVVVLSRVAPGAPVVVQVRVWDGLAGESYEVARAMGGKFGRSGLLSLLAGQASLPPLPYEGSPLKGLESFSLRVGLPHFTTGKLELSDRRDDGTLVWRLEGAAGFRYVVERQTDGLNWHPFAVLTCASDGVVFEDQSTDESQLRLYRARILD